MKLEQNNLLFCSREIMFNFVDRKQIANWWSETNKIIAMIDYDTK